MVRNYFILFQLTLDLCVYFAIALLWLLKGQVETLPFVMVSLLTFVLAQFFSKSYLIEHFVRIPAILQSLFKHQVIFFAFNFVAVQLTQPELNIILMFKIHTVYLLGVMFLRILEIKILRNLKFLDKNGINVLAIGNTNDIQSIIGNYKQEFEVKSIDTLFDDNFDFDDFQNRCIDQNINEVIVSNEIITKKDINDIEEFCINNHIKLKLVPELSSVYGNNYHVEYIGFYPVLNFKKVPLDGVLNAFTKRTFDIIFSGLVIILILSWLTPIIALLIYLESPGNIFFRQKRTGRRNEDFYCLKFRSMTANNKQADHLQASKNDIRITKIGRFIRKTSIDELPQFFNVFIGDMSVVGPRPHMLTHTEEFTQIVDKYLARHYVRPGITGLAQTMGYRGETNTEHDIKGRVKLDLFYISNWNFFLDLKIIFFTFYNAIKGEEKAY